MPTSNAFPHALRHASAVLATGLVLALTHAAGAAETWQQLAPLPDSLGVAAPFAGISGKALIVAGGANFPDKKPWEGGTKVWHDRIHILTEPNSTWKTPGTLPRPLAYGVSLTVNDSVLCLGGSDSTRHYADTFTLTWAEGKLTTSTSTPPLPIPLANAAGAVTDNNSIFLACGSTSPDGAAATSRVFTATWNGTLSAWQELPPLPAPARILPIATARGDAFYLFGGTALETVAGKTVRKNLLDAWCYTPGKGWQRLADLPKPCIAAPSPAPVLTSPDGDTALLLAGDDGSLAGFQPVDQHPGFPSNILRYHFSTNRWEMSGTVPAPRATVPCVKWGSAFVIPSGEVRPGIRSPQVWSFTPAATKP